MSMHLEGPWLTTTGKKRGKKKWASAEQKQQAESAERDWKKLQKRWGAEDTERRRKRALAAAPLQYSPSVPIGRETTSHIKSHSTGVGSALLKPPQMYTGDSMIGIATLHKSNAVPVFSQEDAVDISKMRR